MAAFPSAKWRAATVQLYASCTVPPLCRARERACVRAHGAPRVAREADGKVLGRKCEHPVEPHAKMFDLQAAAFCRGLTARTAWIQGTVHGARAIVCVCPRRDTALLRLLHAFTSRGLRLLTRSGGESKEASFFLPAKQTPTGANARGSVWPGTRVRPMRQDRLPQQWLSIRALRQHVREIRSRVCR